MASVAKVGRNDRCPCGSGRKYKNCCAQKKSGLRGMSPASWAAVACLAVAAAVVVYFLFNLTQSPGTAGGRCPPGQTWSAEHGHCH